MNDELAREHKWLQQLHGEWTTDTDAVDPENGQVRMTGTASARGLGGIWVQVEMNETTDGGEHTSLMTLGYDPAKGRVVGTFVSSMAPNLWTYDGSLDEAQGILTLNAGGPAMDGSGTARYHDIIEIPGPDRWVLRSEIEQDGAWTEFMRMECRRTA